VVPILVNTIQYPIPTPQRMWDLGRVLRRAIESWPTDEKVVVMGTGGLSHQLQGARAGYINPRQTATGSPTSAPPRSATAT
jgi:protocatechuate 4,5-dioxygenase, beta chain